MAGYSRPCPTLGPLSPESRAELSLEPAFAENCPVEKGSLQNIILPGIHSVGYESTLKNLEGLVSPDEIKESKRDLRTLA